MSPKRKPSGGGFVREDDGEGIVVKVELHPGMLIADALSSTVVIEVSKTAADVTDLVARVARRWPDENKPTREEVVIRLAQLEAMGVVRWPHVDPRARLSLSSSGMELLRSTKEVVGSSPARESRIWASVFDEA